MAILASMMLFALAGAETTAKEMRTRATIDKINNVIMAKYESYRTRRLPISIPTTTNPINAAKYRLDALRDIMRMEMPDRFTDVKDAPITDTVYNGTTIIPVPASTKSYSIPSSASANNQGASVCI